MDRYPLTIVRIQIICYTSHTRRTQGGFHTDRTVHAMQEHLMNNDIKTAKKSLREQIMRRISALDPAYRAEADQLITAHLLSLPQYQAARTVFCFVGTDHEINTLPFLAQVLRDQKVLCVPLCTAVHRMEARRIHSVDELRPGHYGLPEPDPRYAPLIEPGEIDLAVIPCLTCSHSGLRLGHGGGYYDAFFGRHTGIFTALLCRERLTTEAIPREPHDLVFRPVVTENGIYS